MSGLGRSLLRAKRIAAMAEMHSLGLSGGRARRMLRIPTHKFSSYTKSMGVKFPYDVTGKWARNSATGVQVVAMRDAGKSFVEIGVALGFSRQRAHQIYQKATARSAPVLNEAAA